MNPGIKRIDRHLFNAIMGVLVTVAMSPTAFAKFEARELWQKKPQHSQKPASAAKVEVFSDSESHDVEVRNAAKNKVLELKPEVFQSIVHQYENTPVKFVQIIQSALIASKQNQTPRTEVGVESAKRKPIPSVEQVRKFLSKSSKDLPLALGHITQKLSEVKTEDLEKPAFIDNFFFDLMNNHPDAFTALGLSIEKPSDSTSVSNPWKKIQERFQDFSKDITDRLKEFWDKNKETTEQVKGDIREQINEVAEEHQREMGNLYQLLEHDRQARRVQANNSNRAAREIKDDELDRLAQPICDKQRQIAANNASSRKQLEDMMKGFAELMNSTSRNNTQQRKNQPSFEDTLGKLAEQLQEAQKNKNNRREVAQNPQPSSPRNPVEPPQSQPDNNSGLNNPIPPMQPPAPQPQPVIPQDNTPAVAPAIRLNTPTTTGDQALADAEAVTADLKGRTSIAYLVTPQSPVEELQIHKLDLEARLEKAQTAAQAARKSASSIDKEIRTAKSDPVAIETERGRKRLAQKVNDAKNACTRQQTALSQNKDPNQTATLTQLATQACQQSEAAQKVDQSFNDELGLQVDKKLKADLTNAEERRDKLNSVAQGLESEAGKLGKELNTINRMIAKQEKKEEDALREAIALAQKPPSKTIFDRMQPGLGTTTRGSSAPQPGSGFGPAMNQMGSGLMRGPL